MTRGLWMWILLLCCVSLMLTFFHSASVIVFAQPNNNNNNNNHAEKTATRTLKKELLAPFDKDIRDDCLSLQIHCRSDVFAHVFLQCPDTCTKLLHEEGMAGTVTEDNSDALYDVGSLRTVQGKRIATDRWEGYVTVIAVTPLLPGMAVYYYEMMEHLHSVFRPKVEFVVLPIDLQLGIHIQVRKDNKVVVLEEESSIESHPWVQHLTSIVPRRGAASKDHQDRIQQTELHTDRVNVYIVSADGYFVERLVSPSMASLQQTIAVYLKTIDYEL